MLDSIEKRGKWGGGLDREKKWGAEALIIDHRMGSTFSYQTSFWERGTLDLVGSMSIPSNNNKIKV